MNDYIDFFLNTEHSVIALECVEIMHPSFEKSFCWVQNYASALNLTHEDGTIAQYSYMPMKIEKKNVSNDLDQTMQISIADIDDAFLKAMLDVRSSQFATIRPQLKFRIYRDDNFLAPIVVLQTLEVMTFSKNSNKQVSFEAKAPELNSVRTGDVYSLERFPMLRGTL
mgnify:CR=1 FL=1